MSEVRLFVPCKPHSLNAERGAKSPFVHRRWTEAIRTAAKQAAEEAKLDRIEGQVAIQSTPHTRMGTGDVGAHWPATKASVDGIVDAGVLPEDGPKVVIGITQWAPVVAKPKGNTGVELVIRTVQR